MKPPEPSMQPMTAALSVRDWPATITPLAAGQVHVWRVSLGSDVQDDALWPLLDKAERKRAERFRFAEHRRRFVIRRAVRRQILAAYLSCPPQEVRFCQNTRGQPVLRDHPQASDLTFSTSHSSDLGLIAVGRQQRIGIDLETLMGDLDVLAISRQFLSPREQAAMVELPPQDRLRAFFRCWTSKEAYLKARGMGLSVPLDQFSVAVDPTRPPGLIESPPDDSSAGWHFTDIPMPNGFIATLAQSPAS